MSSNPDLTICQKHNFNTESTSNHFLRFTINLRIMNIKLQKGKGSIATSTVMSIPKLNSFRNSTSLKRKRIFLIILFFPSTQKEHTKIVNGHCHHQKCLEKVFRIRNYESSSSLPEATTSTLLKSSSVESCNRHRQFCKELQLRRTHLFRRKLQVVSWFIVAQLHKVPLGLCCAKNRMK